MRLAPSKSSILPQGRQGSCVCTQQFWRSVRSGHSALTIRGPDHTAEELEKSSHHELRKPVHLSPTRDNWGAAESFRDFSKKCYAKAQFVVFWCARLWDLVNLRSGCDATSVFDWQCLQSIDRVWWELRLDSDGCCGRVLGADSSHLIEIIILNSLR